VKTLHTAYRVSRPADGPVQVDTGFSHLVVQVDELTATIEALSEGACSPARSSNRYRCLMLGESRCRKGHCPR
jgi:hypothetical protein